MTRYLDLREGERLRNRNDGTLWKVSGVGAERVHLESIRGFQGQHLRDCKFEMYAPASCDIDATFERLDDVTWPRLGDTLLNKYTGDEYIVEAQLVKLLRMNVAVVGSEGTIADVPTLFDHYEYK